MPSRRGGAKAADDSPGAGIRNYPRKLRGFFLPALFFPCSFCEYCEPFPHDPIHDPGTMASNKAHHASGWAAGCLAAAIVAHAGAGGPWQLGTLFALCMGICGGTAPDWMEVAWWTRKKRLWIAHRSLTHWGLGWLAALYWSYHALGANVYAVPVFGFACGGLMHLLADWPNPLGVPWIATRHSLHLWNSGRCDLIIVVAAWVAAFVAADHTWFDDVHTLHALNYVKSLPLHAWLMRAATPMLS